MRRMAKGARHGELAACWAFPVPEWIETGARRRVSICLFVSQQYSAWGPPRETQLFSAWATSGLAGSHFADGVVGDAAA